MILLKFGFSLFLHYCCSLSSFSWCFNYFQFFFIIFIKLLVSKITFIIHLIGCCLFGCYFGICLHLSFVYIVFTLFCIWYLFTFIIMTIFIFHLFHLNEFIELLTSCVDQRNEMDSVIINAKLTFFVIVNQCLLTIIPVWLSILCDLNCLFCYLITWSCHYIYKILIKLTFW